MERVLEVMVWFYEHGDELYDRMDNRERNTKQLRIHEDDEDSESEEEEDLPLQVQYLYVD